MPRATGQCRKGPMEERDCIFSNAGKRMEEVNPEEGLKGGYVYQSVGEDQRHSGAERVGRGTQKH